MKLSEWAAQQGIHYQTAWRWWKKGALPVPARQLASGTILIDIAPASASDRVVVYARVSSHDQSADLDRQVRRLTAWAADHAIQVAEVVAEFGSSVGPRPKLSRLLADPNVTTIVIESHDRLVRFGVEHLLAALAAHGRRILVIDADEGADDLLSDMVEVLTRLCAHLYGRRGARNRALRAVTCAKREPG